MILLVLISLVARATASPADDLRAEAVRYANILTGVDRDTEELDAETDDLNEPDEPDEPDETDAEAHGDVDRDGAEEPDDLDTAEDDGEDRDGFASTEQLLEDDEPDRLASAEDAASDAGAALVGHVTGELATLGDGAGAVGADDVSFAAASAGAAETYESWMRHQRPSRWGRLDVGVEWQRRWSEPIHALSRRYDEVWLVATWRR